MTGEQADKDVGGVEKMGSPSGVKTLDALPDRPLTASEYKALEISESLTDVSPLVEDTDDNTVNGVSFVVGEEYSYYVWHPEEEQWEQVVWIDASGDGQWDIEAVEVIDDETGDVEISFAPSQDTVVEDVYEHVREYTEYVYGGMDGLWYIPDSTVVGETL